MSSLLLLYQTEIQENLNVASKTAEALSSSIELQKAYRENPTIAYVPPPATGPQSRSYQIREALGRLSQTHELLNSMNSEISEQPASDRQRFQSITYNYQQEALRLEQKLGMIRDMVAAAEREDLLLFDNDEKSGSPGNRVDNMTEIQRRNALTTTVKLQKGTNHLERAEALLNKTNIMGHETFQTLQVQTDQIRNIGDSVQDVDAEISQATVIMQNMKRTAIKHKLYLYGALGVLIFILLVFLFAKFR